MDERGKCGHIGGIEDDNDMLDIGAVLLDEVTEFGGYLAIALEEVFAGHALLAGSATGRNDILGVLESHFGIYGPGDVGTFECAVVNLFGDTVYAGFIDVVKTDVGGKAEHERGLGHIGADHSAGAHDGQLFVSQILHIY